VIRITGHRLCCRGFNCRTNSATGSVAEANKVLSSVDDSETPRKTFIHIHIAIGMRKSMCFLFSSLIFTCSMGQDEASIWYLGGGVGLDFTTSPPTQKIPAPSHADQSEVGYATITDASGEVVFYTDGWLALTPGNPPGVIENSNDLMGTGERQIIIDKPGSIRQYYIFYLGTRNPTHPTRELMYAIVDMNANGGRGKVTEKNNTLYVGMHGFFALSGGCNSEEYWLVGEADRNVSEDTDKIFSFKIDSTGITEGAISAPVSIGNSSSYKFSPDGHKIFFSYSGNVNEEGVVLADFDRRTGAVSNPVKLGPCCGLAEFSSNAKFLYINYVNFLTPELRQYDLTGQVPVETTIAVLPDSHSELQLAPDEKIYMVSNGSDSIPALYVINSPGVAGLDCDFEKSQPFADLPGWRLNLPEFPANIFYKNPYNVNAGEDKEICAGDTLTIGGSNPTDQNYQWSPEIYLNDARLINPTLTFTGGSNNATLLTYVLNGSHDGCAKADTMQVSVHPVPSPSIYGSSSVCPGVTGVAYWTAKAQGYSYTWQVEGGTITGDTTSDGIKVDWGASNPDANVQLTVNSNFNCKSDEEIFPVRINVQLETETPKGILSVCANLTSNNSYEIVNTNGSVYTWGIAGGDITAGQTSGKIFVNWNESGDHRLWVSEKSVTQDTVCFGNSDTLTIQVYTDTLQAVIDAVSVNPEDDTKTTITGTLLWQPEDLAPLVKIVRRKEDEAWTSVNALESNPFSFGDGGLNTDDAVYEYQIQTTNGCMLPVSSDIHHTIQLRADAHEEAGLVKLQWSSYDGWPEGVLRYEIWRKIDSDSAFAIVNTVDSQTLSAEFADIDKGFRHRFLIKAVARNKDVYSWSNQQEVTFVHPLFIPNVITPNDDHVNDTFSILHLDLYPRNELVIYNRYGKEVYKKINYNGGWTGEGLATGIYYVQLSVESPRKFYKGWVHVLR
jgi:gliding motility-associated-like protein